MKVQLLYQDEKTLAASPKNGIEIIQSSLLRGFENDFKEKIKWLLIYNSIVHLILWDHCCSIIL
jgi:hypothetical protein